MSLGDNIGDEDLSKTCVVCGKSLHPGEALATMYHGETKLPICCPLCLEAYQADPKTYWERLARRTLLRELQNPPQSAT